MSNIIAISAEKREALGSANARRLRNQGIVPAVIYSKGLETVSIQIPAADAAKIEHHTGLVEINCSCGAKKNAIVQDFTVDPMTGAALNVEFHEVKAGETVKEMIPVEPTGDAIGLRAGGQLEQVMHEIELEGDPAVMPEVLVVDVSGIENNAALTVADLKLPAGVKALAHGDLVVFHVRIPHVKGGEAAPAEAAPAEAAPAKK